MENNRYVPQEMEIDLIELMWRILAQWKAVLIVAVIFAVLVPSAMYVRESRAYEAAKSTVEENTAKVKDIDQATEDILAELLPEDRPAVEQALVNDKILESKQEYLLNSLLVNLNTNEASSLTKGYVFTDVDDWTMQNALISGYSTAFRGDAALTKIMDAMGVDTQLCYIKEMVTVEGSADENMAGYVKVTITCPDKNAGNEVSTAVNQIMRQTNKKLAKNVTNHELKKIYTEVAAASPDVAAAAKQTAYSDLYNTQSQQRAHIATFTEAQTTAYEEITDLQFAAKEAEAESGSRNDREEGNEDTIEADAVMSADEEGKVLPPGFRKKYVAIGFLLGMILYVGLYVVWMVLSRRIDNASAARKYTGTRLLGSYYYTATRNKLLAFFFRTKALTRFRHGKEMDLTIQAERIADEINASCENRHIQKLALLQLFEENVTAKSVPGSADLLSAVAERLEIPVKTISACPTTDARELADQTHAVFFISDSTKTMTLDSALNICTDYRIQKTGTVFIGEV